MIVINKLTAIWRWRLRKAAVNLRFADTTISGVSCCLTPYQFARLPQRTAHSGNRVLGPLLMSTLLTRREQVKVFRLMTGYHRLSYHLYSKLRINHTEQCPCGTGSQTTEHLLQSCPIYEPLRKGIWPDDTPVARKLYGSLGDLRCTVTFIEKTGVSI